jgi:hypothetical protein
MPMVHQPLDANDVASAMECTMLQTDKNLAVWTLAATTPLEDDGSRLEVFYQHHRSLLLDLQMMVRRWRIQLFALLLAK